MVDRATCPHPANLLVRFPEGAFCAECNTRVFPPHASRSSPYSRAWAGDVWAQDAIEKLENGDGREPVPDQEIGR